MKQKSDISEMTWVWIFVVFIMAWSSFWSESFTYFWIEFIGVVSVFLFYHASTWEKDIKRMADKHEMSGKNVERDD